MSKLYTLRYYIFGAMIAISLFFGKEYGFVALILGIVVSINVVLTLYIGYLVEILVAAVTRLAGKQEEVENLSSFMSLLVFGAAQNSQSEKSL